MHPLTISIRQASKAPPKAQCSGNVGVLRAYNEGANQEARVYLERVLVRAWIGYELAFAQPIQCTFSENATTQI